MDRWKQYLHESHPEETLRDWAQRLFLFRFFRAFGGHANDGDALTVAYSYRDAGQLEEALTGLGIELHRYKEKPPQAQIGVSYRGDDFLKFPSIIPGTTWIAQPGQCVIAGVKVFIWCEADRVRISVGDRYDVTEADVRNAEVVERALKSIPLERVDPPLDSNHYICPTYYPEYFSK